MKDGKLKIQDGTTGNISWRQGRGGFSKDFDGEPIAQNKNYADLKNRPKHSVRMGNKKKGRQPHMGSKPSHNPKMGEK